VVRSVSSILSNSSQKTLTKPYPYP
jgi:hypothetical protein